MRIPIASLSVALSLTAAYAQSGPGSGVILTPLNPVTVDESLHSINDATPAEIEFVNRTEFAIDIYGIDFNGHRVNETAGLQPGASYVAHTFLTHPFLIVASGTGGTTDRGTGKRLAGFQAVTPDIALFPSGRETAIIADPDADDSVPAPKPGDPGTMDANGIYRIGNGVSAPKLLQQTKPEYSEVARRLHVSGTVGLRFVVADTGQQRDFTVARSVGYGLDEKAIESIRNWKFSPATKNGIPVPAYATAEVNFQLLPDPLGTTWSAGPMKFTPDPGVTLPDFTPPVTRSGALPAPGGDPSRDIVTLEFTVNAFGAVKNVHPLDGSVTASELLTPFVAAWKFFPAMSGNDTVEATGSVRFEKGSVAPGAASASPGKSIVNPRDHQVYVWIPPGTFTMGCSPGDAECTTDPTKGYTSAESPVHSVSITKGFWIGQSHATQEAYERAAGTNPSQNKGPKRPVEGVTWSAADSFCRSVGLRLPTEAEWEYAARAGSLASRYDDVDRIAWYQDNSGNTSHEVMQKEPNAWGLYDMLGNGWQWTADWSSDRYSGADEIDPQGPATGTLKILRGGSWRNGSKASRVSTRLRGNFDGGFSFRCAGNSLDPQVTTPIPAQLPAPHPGVPVFDAELGREVYRPGGAVSVPRILRKWDPEYSEEARQAKINGTVMLKIVIDEQGNVVHPTVLRGLGFGLDQKAVQAVKKWKFAPAQKDGHPIPAFAQVQVVFRLL